jgi:hypothetical protein
MRPNKLFLILGVLLAVVALNAVVWAEGETATAWPKKPSWSFRLGTYFADTSTQLRVDGPNGIPAGDVIDLTNVLKIPSTATVFRVNGDFRIASWFGLGLEYYGLSRSKTVTIDQDFSAGGIDFAINDTVSSSWKTSYVDLALKFFLLHRKRFDLGVWVGAKVHFIQLDLMNESAELGTATVNKKTWFPVPAGGIVFSYSILPRLYLYGKAGWFSYKISDTSKYSNTRFDISLDYYVWKALGLGVTYAYSEGSVNRDNADFTGYIKNRDSGLQVYAAIGF